MSLVKVEIVAPYVTGRHIWAVGDGGTGQCDHGANHKDSAKEFIAVGSVALKELRKVVWDARFLKKIPHFLNFWWVLQPILVQG